LLVDSDSYLRMHLVEELWRTGDWFEKTTPVINAPYGDDRPWPRIMDALLIGTALPFAPFMDMRDAFYWAGVIFSPLLGMLLIISLSWGLRPYLNNGGFILLGALFVLQPSLYATFLLARPDHHSLQLFLFGTVFVMLLRIITEKSKPELAYGAGAVLGLGIWVSVEMLITLLASAAILGLMWLWQGGEHWRTLRRLFWSAFAVLSVAMITERPPGEWQSVEYDQYSIVHWALVASMAFVWTGFERLDLPRLGGAPARFIRGAAAVALVALVMALLYPKFFLGPFAEIDPKVMPVWYYLIRENQPLLPTSLHDAGKLVFLFGPALYAVGYGTYAIKGGPDSMKAGWLYFIVAISIYIPLTLHQTRWGTYVAFLMLIPWALLITQVWRWSGGVNLAGREIPLRVPLILALLSGHVIIGGGLMTATVSAKAPGKTPTTIEACRWPLMVEPLRERAEAKPGGEKLIVLSFIHQGGEIVYRTGQRAVGAPYHRNVAGILDTVNFMSDEGDEAARRILARRGVDYVVICRNSHDALRYLHDGRNTLYRKLASGMAPAWLREEPLPAEAARYFKMYRAVN
ncbi:MAG: hypothetical protein OEY85_15760, partial [Rhodospirillales bacterium]|nr:hypothetical protein [Rhodospirillales bacterium]